jgi:diguanylate cyclase (GGDEF)-like protein/PAS domain S-box-containing protein
MATLRALLLDGDGSAGGPFEQTLAACGCAVTRAAGLDAALARLAAENFDVAVTALTQQGQAAIDPVRRLVAAAPALPVVVVVPAGGHAAGLEAIASGAQDYLPADDLAAPAVARALRAALERARYDAAVRAQEQRLRVVHDHAPVVIATLTPDGKLTSLNPAFERATGWPTAEWIGEQFGPLLHADDRPAAIAMMQRAFKGDVVPPVDLRMETMAGEYVIGNFTAIPIVEHGTVTQVVGIARDVTELRRFEALERAAARTDKLTGLSNRRGGEEAIAREVARATRENTSVGFALFDVDHFKKVNDTYGHENGDTVLKAVSGVLREATRGYDLAVRWGGEEMLAILPGADLLGAKNFAERVRVNVAALEGLPCKVTTSAGVAEWSRGQEVTTVLARADARLYDAKHGGRNRVC